MTACRLMSQYGGDHLLGKTLPKAQWTKGFNVFKKLSHITSWFALVGLVWLIWFGLGCLVWQVWFGGRVRKVWFGRCGSEGLFW